MTLKILILTDGKMGDLVQCRGVAYALTDEDNIEEYVVKPGWLGSLPLKNMPLSRSEKSTVLAGVAVVDIVIASGRRTVPYFQAIVKEASNQAYLVFLKDPRYNYDHMDFIWSPSHDKLTAPNVFSTPTSPHTISPNRLSAAAKSGAERFRDFNSPIVGLILGGNSASVTWNDKLIDEFCGYLSAIPAEASILITASRRTPQNLRDATLAALKHHQCWIYDDTGSNPYLEILACSDRLIITGDSHNMVSEALAAGKPVHVYRPPGLHAKLRGFLDHLENGGVIEDISKGYACTDAKLLDATPQIAAEILKRYRTSHDG